MKRGRWIAWCVGLLAMWGCGPVISKELREEAAPIRGLAEVRQDVDQYKNHTIIVGGEILETVNHEDETTTLVVLDYPLGHREKPDESADSQGRFMVEVAGFLDPEVFARGREVTVAGVVEGLRVAPVGKTNYRYVVIQARQVHLWQPRAYGYPYPYPYPYYWGYPGWGPPFDEGYEEFEGEGERGEGHERGREGGERGEQEEGGEREGGGRR
jgi:outer membrane lipoprotein